MDVRRIGAAGMVSYLLKRDPQRKSDLDHRGGVPTHIWVRRGSRARTILPQTQLMNGT